MSLPEILTPPALRAATGSVAPALAPAADRQPLPPLALSGTRTGWPVVVAHVLVDATLMVAAVAGIHWLAAVVAGASEAYSLESVRLGGTYLAGLMVAATAQELYLPIPHPPAVELRRWVVSVALITAGMSTAVVVTFGGSSRDAIWLATSGAVLCAAIPLGRAALRQVCSRATWWGTRVIVVGSGNAAAAAIERLLKKPSLGLRPIGFVADADSPPLGELPWLGPPDRLAEVAGRYATDRALVAVHGFDAEELADVVALPSSAIRHWMILPPLERYPGLWSRSREVGGLPAFETTNRLASPLLRGVKRCFDLSLALSLGTVIVPLLALIAVLVRFTSPGPVFYSQERIGWHGRRFRAWKFRSMRRDADEVLQQYLTDHPELRAEWQANHKLKHDPRITSIGRWLRLTSLDELPQIWNVVCGEMSLIGPRPIVEAEIEKYGDQYEHYIQVVPGITGLWQISGRNNTTYEERVNYDAYYVRNWSPWLDLYILACTARVVLLGEGAY